MNNLKYDKKYSLKYVTFIVFYYTSLKSKLHFVVYQFNFVGLTDIETVIYKHIGVYIYIYIHQPLNMSP